MKKRTSFARFSSDFLAMKKKKLSLENSGSRFFFVPGAWCGGRAGMELRAYREKNVIFVIFDFRALSWQDHIQLGSANESFY